MRSLDGQREEALRHEGRQGDEARQEQGAQTIGAHPLTGAPSLQDTAKLSVPFLQRLVKKNSEVAQLLERIKSGRHRRGESLNAAEIYAELLRTIDPELRKTLENKVEAAGSQRSGSKVRPSARPE